MKRMLTVLAVAMTASALNAKTVAWWPMNGTDGAKAGGIASRGDTSGALTAYPAHPPAEVLLDPPYGAE